MRIIIDRKLLTKKDEALFKAVKKNSNNMSFSTWIGDRVMMIIFHRPDRLNHSQCPKHILSLFPQNPTDCHTFQTLNN